jgi:DNA-binding response OmpR family regulator
MSISPDSRARFNLSRTAVLLFDPTPMGLAILGQILSGLGAKKIHRCLTLDDAKEALTSFEIDLMLIDSIAESGEGYELVRWLRRNAPEPNKHAPVLLTAGHTRASDVAKARDCGSHFIVTKPLAPIVVLERIIWIAREGRGFLLSDDYVGPDRRIVRKEALKDHPRRRREDAEAAQPGEAPSSDAPPTDLPFIDRPLKAAAS